MDISVIIPTYKPGDYIKECLRSIKSQTLDKDRFEVIIVLNGEKEPWYDDIRRYSEEYPDGFDVKLLYTPENGVSNARNIGIEAAKGEYIAFIDDDDYISPDYLNELLKVAGKGTMVLSDSLSFNDGSEGYDYSYSMHQTYLNNCNNKKTSIYKIRHLLNGPCMKLIPREMIEDIRFNTSFQNGEDGLFVYELTRNVKQFKLAEDSAIYFRRFRENSAVTRKVSLKYIWQNAFLLSCAQTKIFLKNFSKYDKIYFMIRILASFKGALYRSFNINR